MKYYRDIDGLRAVAVISVMFYHFDFSFAPGGYVGVDVFFVISGFLITQHIYWEIENKKFTITGFYIKRIRRIIPALFFVVLTTVAFSLYLLPTAQLAELSYSVFSVSTFTSNIFFWAHLDYFSVAAEMKPLLHTWSLSVEEQFYIIFPVFMLIISKSSKKIIVFWLILFCALSFLISASPLGLDRPAANFYLPVTRFWELLVGSILAFSMHLSKRNSGLKNNLISIVGLALILSSIAFLDENSDFPGLNALPVVVGTAFVIYSCKDGPSILSVLLSNKCIVYLGLISYSLYLWHWPVVSLSKNIIYGEILTSHKFMLLGVTLLLSAMTYQFIEQPFRQKEKLKNALKIKTGILSLGFLSVVAASLLLYINGDLQKEADFVSCFKTPETMESTMKCSFGDVNSNNIFMLYGDSHSQAMYPAFEKLALENGWRGIFSPFPGCPPIFDVFRKDGIGNASNCTGEYSKNVQNFLNEYGNSINMIYLVSRWRLYEKGWVKNGRAQDATHFLSDNEMLAENALDSSKVLKKSLIKTINEMTYKLNIRTNILVSVPTLPVDIDKFESRRVLKEEYISQRLFIDSVFNYLKKNPLVNIIDPIEIYCKAYFCDTHRDNKPLYSDDNHVSHEGALLLYPLLQDSLGRGEN